MKKKQELEEAIENLLESKETLPIQQEEANDVTIEIFNDHCLYFEQRIPDGILKMLIPIYSVEDDPNVVIAFNHGIFVRIYQPALSKQKWVQEIDNVEDIISSDPASYDCFFDSCIQTIENKLLKRYKVFQKTSDQ